MLEDFYCCEAGEVFETQRYLFRVRDAGGG